MTEIEKQELDQLRKSGKLITKQQNKKIWIILVVMFVASLVSIFGGLLIAFLLNTFGHNEIVGGAIIVIGIASLIGTVVYYSFWYNRICFYKLTKRKHPEYFINESK